MTMISIKRTLLRHKDLLQKHRDEFWQIFGKNISRYYSYKHMVKGFDIVTFDEDIGTPDGVSTKDFIEKKFGNRAVEIINELISL